MQLSQKYDGEQKALKVEIEALKCAAEKEQQHEISKNQFIKTIRKFMEMKKLTPVILHELVEKIEVYHIQGTGKNRTQEIVIHYNFVGVLEMPEIEAMPDKVVLNARQGVDVSYSTKQAG